MTEQDKINLLDNFAKAIRVYGAKEVLIAFLTRHPSEYMEISNIFRMEKVRKQVAKLFQKW